jgi:Stage II sporulation protein E (SpoIIE)
MVSGRLFSLVSMSGAAFQAATILASAAEQLRNMPILIAGVLGACLTVAFLSLWWNARDYRVFLTMGLYFCVISPLQFIRFFGITRYDWAFAGFASVFVVESAAAALDIRSYQWRYIAWPVTLTVLILGWLPYFEPLRTYGIDVCLITTAVFAVIRIVRGSTRDRVVATAFLTVCVVGAASSTELRPLAVLPRSLEVGGWRWSSITTVIVLLGFMTLVVFVRDLLWDRSEKLRLASELAAGRAVQQMLLAVPEVSSLGWALDAVYLPAAEVGGDFYAVFETTDSGRLLVVGDVSGKGLRAAMVVATILGSLRGALGANGALRPAALLSSLNQTLLRTSTGGFTTCLCARLDGDGLLTLANAGQLSPYRNGSEVDLPPALPLGLVADSVYEECQIMVTREERITFLSDGVVEARDKNGELLGFARTQELSARPANEIAQIARRFGQEDDITVVTLTRIV